MQIIGLNMSQQDTQQVANRSYFWGTGGADGEEEGEEQQGVL